MSVVETARRIGLLSVRRTVALGAAVSTWGPSTATAYAAAALQHPLRLAVVDDYGQLTYFQLEHRSSRVAAAIKHRGITRNHAVGLLCRNHRGFVEANIALAKLGTRVVYLNPGLPPEQLVAVVEREALTMVIADRDLVDQLAELSPSVQRVESAPQDEADWSFPGLERWRPLIQMPRPFAKDDPVVLTSGTTGAPKGTVRKAGASALATAFGVLEAIPYERGDTMVLGAPLFHAWGLSQMLIGATLAHTIVLRSSFDAETTMNDVEAYGAEVLIVVPVMLQRILQIEHEGDVSSLRITASSGSALPGTLATRWMGAFGPTLYSLYGSTEVGQVSVASPDQLLADPSTAGSALRGVSVRIVDDNGIELADGEIGRIVVGSGAHFDGYTDGGTKSMVDQFMSIGDLGRLGADGQLHVSGRSDDMIISGGENVYPENVERAILASDLAIEVSVVGMPDNDLGHRVCAFIVLETGAAASSATSKLKKALRKSLAPHEIPREFVYLDELPRNGAGKVLRRKLVAPESGRPNVTKATSMKPMRSSK